MQRAPTGFAAEGDGRCLDGEPADTRVEHIGSVIRLCVRKKAAEADKQKEAQPTFGRLCLFFCLSSENPRLCRGFKKG